MESILKVPIHSPTPILLLLTIAFSITSAVTTFDKHLSLGKLDSKRAQDQPILPQWIGLIFGMHWVFGLVLFIIDWKYAIAIFILKFLLSTLGILEIMGSVITAPLYTRTRSKGGDKSESLKARPQVSLLEYPRASSSVDSVVFCTANSPLVESFIVDSLIPVANILQVPLRRIDKASNDPDSSRFWISVAHRLIYASDIVVLITTDWTGNVIFMENAFLGRDFIQMSFFDSLFDGTDIDREKLLKVMRPNRIDITFRDRNSREAGSEIRYQRDGLSATIDLRSEPNEIQTVLRDAFEVVANQRSLFLSQLKIDYPDFFFRYDNLRRAIYKDPDIVNSISHLSVVRIVAPPDRGISDFYNYVVAFQHKDQIYRFNDASVKIFSRINRLQLPRSEDIKSFYLSWQHITRLGAEKSVWAKVRGSFLLCMFAFGAFALYVQRIISRIMGFFVKSV